MAADKSAGSGSFSAFSASIQLSAAIRSASQPFVRLYISPSAFVWSAIIRIITAVVFVSSVCQFSGSSLSLSMKRAISSSGFKKAVSSDPPTRYPCGSGFWREETGREPVIFSSAAEKRTFSSETLVFLRRKRAYARRDQQNQYRQKKRAENSAEKGLTKGKGKGQLAQLLIILQFFIFNPTFMREKFVIYAEILHFISNNRRKGLD